MVEAQELEEVLESETGLDWTVAEDKPTLKRFVAVSFEYKVKYYESKDHWRFSFEDAASSADRGLGPIQTDSIMTEFRPFVKETYSEVEL